MTEIAELEVVLISTFDTVHRALISLERESGLYDTMWVDKAGEIVVGSG